MERTFALTFPLLIVTATLAGCGLRDDSPRTTATRTVDAFDAIELRGAANIEVAAGGAQSLNVEGSARAVEALGTEVRGQRLVITSKRSWWQPSSGDLKVIVTVPQLREVEVNGAGDLKLANLAGGDFALILSGAGNAVGSGQVGRLSIEMNGAGNVDFTNVVAGDTRVRVNGAGNVDVTSTALLDATMNGVGSIRYGGPPTEVRSQLNGVGSIKAR